MLIKVLIGFIIVNLITIGSVEHAFAWRWILYHETSFKGKVIDADTKIPLEGIEAIAKYKKQLMGLEANTHDVDTNSTITDKNGEFHIPSYTTLMAPWYLKEEFTRVGIGKSGYRPDFLIIPVKNINVVKSIKEDSKGNVISIEQEVIDEGIVYVKRWYEDISEKEKALIQKSSYYPFFPLKDAEVKVRNLEIPFEYIEKELYSKNIGDLWRVWRGSVPESFKVYTVIGLKKIN